MSFIAENPLIIPKVESVSPIPLGARAIFPKQDGWYDVDSEGVVSKILDDNDGSLIIDIETSIRDYGGLLVYDKNGKPTTNIQDVHAGIFRCKFNSFSTREEEDSYHLIIQDKTHVINKDDGLTVYVCVSQKILDCSSSVRFRDIEDLLADEYPDFEDYSVLPWDGLDGENRDTIPLSAHQGYILDQKIVKAQNDLLERESILNKVTDIDDDANNRSYPTAKAVKDYVDSMVQRIMVEASPIKTATLTLYASQWLESDGMYSQTVTINNATEYSKIDLQPTAEQLVIFHEKDIAFVTENDNGVITVYCIGQKPINDYIVQATITEVKNDE